MKNEGEIERILAKTPEQRFLHSLEHEFHYAPKIAEAILNEAQACLLGSCRPLRPGQVRIILSKRGTRHAAALRETPSLEVTLTVDDGTEDCQVLRQYGSQALRRVRILRLLDEAVEQGAAATQEDLARVLNTSSRTIKRDFAELEKQGHYLATRGNLEGIGRGQTHKGQIIRRWLQGETYDQIAMNTHHCAGSIQRYIKVFVQVIRLHRQDFADSEIARLLEIGLPLVEEYLLIYQHHHAPECRERLEKQLQRFAQAALPEKGGR